MAHRTCSSTMLKCCFLWYLPKVSTFVMCTTVCCIGEKKEKIGRKPFNCALDVSTLKFSRKCHLIGHKLVFMHTHDFQRVVLATFYNN